MAVAARRCSSATFKLNESSACSPTMRPSRRHIQIPVLSGEVFGLVRDSHSNEAAGS
jgi:hypothetical protein